MDTTAHCSPDYYKEYDELRERVESTNKALFRPDPSFLTGQIVTVGAFLGASLGLFLAARSSFLVAMLSAAFLAFAFGQAGFMMHDACHGVGGIQWKRSARRCFNMLFAWSMDWWEQKHDRHHSSPNDPDRDPDLLVSVVAFTPKQAQGKKTSAGRFIARHQDIFFFLFVSFEVWNLRAAIVRSLLKERTRRARTDLFLIAAHALVYLGALFFLLPPWHALAFVAVHNGLLGLYLGLTFAANHIGMEIVGPEKGLDYLRQQALTTRNIIGGWWLTRLLGGLNYQIEHHLFPWLTWDQLAQVAPLVEQFCLERERSVAYHSVRPRQACREVLECLRSVARSAA